MQVKKIRLTNLMAAKQFVKAAMDCQCEVDVCYNSLVIDAKSILGVLSMDLTKDLTVKIHGRDEAFERYLETIQPLKEKIA